MVKTILGVFAALAISFFATVGMTANAQTTNSTSNSSMNTTNTTNTTTNTTNSTTNTTNTTNSTKVPSGAPKTGFQPK